MGIGKLARLRVKLLILLLVLLLILLLVVGSVGGIAMLLLGGELM